MTPTNPNLVLIPMEDEERNNPLLQAELAWIDDHKERYTSDWHRLAVKNNIIKRYELNRIIRTFAV